MFVSANKGFHEKIKNTANKHIFHKTNIIQKYLLADTIFTKHVIHKFVAIEFSKRSVSRKFVKNSSKTPVHMRKKTAARLLVEEEKRKKKGHSRIRGSPQWSDDATGVEVQSTPEARLA